MRLLPGGVRYRDRCNVYNLLVDRDSDELSVKSLGYQTSEASFMGAESELVENALRRLGEVLSEAGRRDVLNCFELERTIGPVNERCNRPQAVPTDWNTLQSAALWPYETEKHDFKFDA